MHAPRSNWLCPHCLDGVMVRHFDGLLAGVRAGVSTVSETCAAEAELPAVPKYAAASEPEQPARVSAASKGALRLALRIHRRVRMSFTFLEGIPPEVLVGGPGVLKRSSDDVVHFHTAKVSRLRRDGINASMFRNSFRNQAP